VTIIILYQLFTKTVNAK